MTNFFNKFQQDGLLEEAIQIIGKYGRDVLPSQYLQKKLNIGFKRAIRLMTQLEALEILENDGWQSRFLMVNKKKVKQFTLQK